MTGEIKLEKLNAQTYSEKDFQNSELEWKDVYILPRRVTINTNLRNALQISKKVIPNLLFLYGRT